MAQMVRKAVRPLQQGAKRWVQQTNNQAQGPAVAVAVAGAEMKSWTAAGMSRFLAANPAASTSASSDPGLLRILRSEIEHERDDYKQPSRLARGPPKPWSLTDNPGKEEIILRRTYGQEDISVTAVFQPSDGPELNEDDENEGSGSDNDAVPPSFGHLTVTVSKRPDEPPLEFSLTAYDGSYVVEHVTIARDEDSKDKRSSYYGGPPYDELDEELRNEFDDYLSARGINESLTKYLKDLLPDKERREYLKWLKDVENFVRK